jgi:serine/threonine-protein kinase
MGEVVLAEHLGLGKRVVVKLLHEEFAKDSAVTKRMQIEARSLAALASPHIVQVSDFGQTATGRTYIVMEQLVGRTLGVELRERGALPIAEAIGYVVQVLAGLEAAHALGIIHRDIKPDNIFLCDATKGTPRTVKVLDFGVAKVLDVATAVGRPAIPHLQTEEGGVVGTPRVIAPEQACGKPVDARTDVYATGMLLYTLVAGRGPFAHLTDHIKLLKANVTEQPEPPSHFAEQRIPPALDAAILRALAKSPADRFPSAEAFATELRLLAEALANPPSASTEPLPLMAGAAGDGPSHAAPERRAREDGDDDPTVQLPSAATAPAGTLASAAIARERAELASVRPNYAPLAKPSGQPAKPDRAPGRPAANRHAHTGVRTFVTLALISAAVSAILLFILHRVAR